MSDDRCDCPHCMSGKIAELIDQRDRARRIAVTLEQENAAQADVIKAFRQWKDMPYEYHEVRTAWNGLNTALATLDAGRVEL